LNRYPRFHFVATALILICWASFALGQAETATISGRVTDQQGAVVVNAALIAWNVDTNLKVQQLTNREGLYVITGLKPGSYRVTVSAPGFRTVNLAGVVLNVQDLISQNFKLALGPVTESITVLAEEARVNTESPAVSTVIDRQFVANTPLNGRSFQDLILLTPGVVTQSPQSQIIAPGAVGDFSVHGQRTESNNYMVDGVSGNTGTGVGTGVPGAYSGGTISGSTALGTTQSLVSVDALQEFRVQGSTYAAEFGHGPGAQFSLVTRSGTNQLHGTAFDYLRNDFFDANDWFNDHNGLPISPLRQNDFGGTLGGPVWIPGVYRGKDKTFFFFSYEGLRLTQPQSPPKEYVPSLSLRQSAPAALQPILSAYPLPTPGGVDYGNGLADFIKSFSLPSQIDATSIRLDHAFGPRLLVFVRYGNTTSATGNRSLSSVGNTSVDGQTVTVGANLQLSGSRYDELRLGYSSGESRQVSRIDSFGGATPVGLSQQMGLGASINTLAFFNVFIPGTGHALLETAGSNSASRQWNLVDTFSLSTGEHQLKFGVDYRRIESPFSPASPFAVAFFFGEQSVLNNTADALFIGKNLPASPIFHQFALFGQDSFRVTRRLTLSFGLRWEVNPPLTEAHGNQPYTLFGDIDNPSTLSLAPRGTPLWNTNWHNVAPRLGISWMIHDSPGFTTALRSGWGIFFDSANSVAALTFNGIGFGALTNASGSPLPVTAQQLNFSPSVNPPFPLAYFFPRDLRAPYTLHRSASMEQQLGQAQTLTVSYVGSGGRRLLQQQERNIAALNPNFTEITYYPQGVTSNYDALEVQLQRRMTRGLQALASYTWSHSLDFGSSNQAQPLTRGNSDFDVRHNFSGSASWDLPSTISNKAAGILLNGWGIDGRISARTGFPVTILGGALVDPGTGNTFSGSVNLVPGQPIYLYGSQYPGGRSVNPAAFMAPSNNTQGNAPRNFVRGFGATQLNLAIRRDFHLYERLKLQFRSEAFNILNHPNFGLIDSSLDDATFGQAVAMLNQSIATTNALYQQGGARSLQFALKLLF
jgi:hypothetical protein